MQDKVKDSYVDLFRVGGLTLSVFSSEDVIQQSVTRIEEDSTYKENGQPVPHGINDDRMGTMDKDMLCKTCKGNQSECPGHFGHIKLEKPVYHGNLLDYVRKVLRCVCFSCSHLLADNQENGPELKKCADIKNEKSRFNAVFKLSSNLKQCRQCERLNHVYRRGTLKIDYEIKDPNAERPNNDSKQTLWPEEAQRILTNIKKEHLKMLGLSKEVSDPANMIIENLAVAPPPVRPSVAMMGTTGRSEDDLTVAYKAIIKQNNEIKRAIKSGASEVLIQVLRNVLQFYVATVMDNDIQGAGTQKHKSGQPIKSIRARLKGKEGRLRGNLMGKRVNFSARSVITPDPNLRLDQLGVPKEIAINMTIPEVVTEHNKNYLRQLVDRGATNWPGAKYIQRSDGRCIDLAMLPNRTDQHLEIGYTVERHLQDNDYVIFNRQPSLHKMSMMGHRIRVLDFQTFRLNLSVTTPYNADFDGDEMNMHVPQSMETKAEIKEIMAVPRQIVAPQGNKPCMGIVQDALLGIMRLTSKDTFVDKPLLMNIMMFVDYDLEKGLPQPAILKPKPLWTGKQVISLVIPSSINFQTGPDDYMDQKKMHAVVQKGELISGVLKKQEVGNTSGGMIHLIWKDLGPQACCDILSNIQLVVNNWLVNTGFTVGVSDIIAKTEITNQVRETMKEQLKEVEKIIRRTQAGKLVTQPGKSMIESFENDVNSALNDARSKAGNIALGALAPDNRLKNMVEAGSKGSNMNISQIMACVGQQNVDGKRIPFGFNRRSLPHFAKDDYGPESKGFVASSYLTGLTPTEFYFHAMGGREGLIDTAVKTADTGYISRRLMKALEDVMVKYDGTVRTSKEMIVTFLYGEDGMAGEHFESINLDLPGLNNEKLAEKYNLAHNIESERTQKKLVEAMGQERATEVVQDRELQTLLREEMMLLKSDRDYLRETVLKQDIKKNLYMPVNIPRLLTTVKSLNGIKHNSLSDLDPRYLMQKRQELLESLCVIPEARLAKGLSSAVIKENHANSTMLFKIFLRCYLNTRKIIMEDRLDTQTFDQLVTNISEVFRSAIVHPGEMVGSIGAQSMGEPATQMTLNTFHNAGISSKNVTLGVPRLKEVINVAKTIKTPSLKIFPSPEISKNDLAVSRVGSQIQYENLSHLVSDWGIYYDPDPQNTIIKDDEELIQVYNMTGGFDDNGIDDDRQICRWVLRFSLFPETIFDEHYQFVRDVGRKIDRTFNSEERAMEIIYSVDDMDQKVIRIRPYGLQDDDKSTVSMVLREFAESVLKNITLRGFEEISKVSYKKKCVTTKDCEMTTYNTDTGSASESKEHLVIETDGVALFKVFSVEGVDATRTTSNNVMEIFQVLGVEAARISLIRELRFILGTYDIYVNYRHLGTLVDVMTQRGILTSITRHGINRVNSGPLRKCSFEETTEILLEAAFFGEHDPLSGITENIIFGQLAPYGTGCFDLIIDRQALNNCIVTREGRLFEQPYQGEDEETPMQFGGDLTPTIIGPTPNPYETGLQGQSDYYPQNGTPNVFTPPYAGNTSPAYPTSPAYQTGQTGYYSQHGQNYTHPSPMPGYGNTPGYCGGGQQTSVAYSPSGPAYGGASQHSSYSPTNVGNYHTPSYTPNYQPSHMTPIQHSTPTYQYGGPTAGGPAYHMPSLSTPVAQMSSGNSGHNSAYGGGASLQTPGYYPGMMSPNPMTRSSIPQVPATVAYDPTAAMQPGDDSSDSDDS